MKYKHPPKPDQWFWARVVNEDHDIFGCELVAIGGKPMLAKKDSWALDQMYKFMKGLDTFPGCNRVVSNDYTSMRMMISEDITEAVRVVVNLAAASEYAEMREYRECGVLVTNADIDTLKDAVEWGRHGPDQSTIKQPINPLH